MQSLNFISFFLFYFLFFFFFFFNDTATTEIYTLSLHDALPISYQYTESELRAAVQEAARVGRRVAVHATGEPGTLYATQAGVASIEHASQLGEETMRLMREKQI